MFFERPERRRTALVCLMGLALGLPALADPAPPYQLPAPFQVPLPPPGAPPRPTSTAMPQDEPGFVTPPPEVNYSPHPISTPTPEPSPAPLEAPTPGQPARPHVDRTHELITHAAVLAGLFSIDLSLNNSINKHGLLGVSANQAQPLFMLGDGATDVALAQGMHIFAGSPTMLAASADSTRAILNAAVNVQLLKTLFGRGNPNIGPGQGDFKGPTLASGHDSFPSGHTASAFAFATAMGHYYPKKRPVLYTLAGLTGLSTLAVHVHFASDVYAGALLGILSGDEATQRKPNLMFIKF